MSEQKVCSDCGKIIPATPPRHTGGTGYGIDPDTKAIRCYACCAEWDRKNLLAHGNGTLYLDQSDPFNPVVTNWPGTLRITVSRMRKGAHNIARTRRDVWFWFGCADWHGVQYGEWSQICRVKRLKAHT